MKPDLYPARRTLSPATAIAIDARAITTAIRDRDGAGVGPRLGKHSVRWSGHRLAAGLVDIPIVSDRHGTHFRRSRPSSSMTPTSRFPLTGPMAIMVRPGIC